MRHLIFFALVLLCALAQAQAPTETYKTVSQVNDSIWKVETFQTFEISNIVGDTEYAETYSGIVVPSETVYFDSIQLVDYLYISATNAAKESIAKLRNARQYRRVNIVDNAFEAQLTAMGANLDSMRIKAYANQLKGKWKYVDNQGAERTFDLIDHPSMTTRLRMDEDGGLNENMNVTIDERWKITVRMNSVNFSFVWDGEDRDRPRFFLEKNNLPGTATGGFDNSRWIKIQ